MRAATLSVAFAATATDNAGAAPTPIYTLAGTAITSPHDFPAGTSTVTVTAGDAAGNAATPVTFDVTVTPTAALSALSGPKGGTFTAQILLSEVSTDFTADDLEATNATVTLSGTGSIAVTVDFSEPVTGFTALDLDATISALSGAGARYTARSSRRVWAM